MTSVGFSFPRPLAAVISRLPVLPPSFVFSRILNLALRRTVGGDALRPLHGKCVCIRVSDAGLRLYFTVDVHGFTPMPSTPAPDLAITAAAHDFYLLATRQEDPDALFFSRRLVVEGDTELGLIAKNTLDGIELPAFRVSSLAPAHVWAAAKNAFSRS